MRGWTTDDLKGKPCARLNTHVLPLDPLLDRPPLKGSTQETLGESELQRKCDSYLESRGCKRLTAKNAPALATGWFGHLNKPEGNPFLPDLVIFHEPNDRPALLVELKTVDRFQPGQREMINRGAWTLCWSFAEFARVFNEWLTRKEKS